MKKVEFFTAIVLALLVYDVEAKVFTKCGLTKELLNNGFERSYVGNCKFIFGALLGHIQVCRNYIFLF